MSNPPPAPSTTMVKPTTTTTTATPEVTAAIQGARELLAAWTVAQYLDDRRTNPKQQQHTQPHKHAVCVDPGDTLGEILDTLARHNILSAPVVEKTSHRYSGFVDVAFLLSIFVKGCRRWLSREYGTGKRSSVRVYNHSLTRSVGPTFLFLEFFFALLVFCFGACI